ncbi:MAG: hypothetical protein LW630_09640 [Saprospiraceae bacterium]|nr:hypothetical protein [Saprospiraceae bacterium]
MKKTGLDFTREIEQNIYYKELEEPIGIRRVDFVVEGKILVESKAISHLEDINVQVLTISKPIHPESIHRNFRFLARQHLAHQQSRTRRHGNAYHGMAAGNHSILKMRHLTQVRKAIRRTGS